MEMIETELNLTAQERSTLQEISRLTGKTEDELIREAVCRRPRLLIATMQLCQ